MIAKLSSSMVFDHANGPHGFVHKVRAWSFVLLGVSCAFSRNLWSCVETFELHDIC